MKFLVLLKSVDFKEEVDIHLTENIIRKFIKLSIDSTTCNVINTKFLPCSKNIHSNNRLRQKSNIQGVPKVKI